MGKKLFWTSFNQFYAVLEPVSNQFWKMNQKCFEFDLWKSIVELIFKQVKENLKQI